MAQAEPLIQVQFSTVNECILVGHTDAASPEAVTSPGESRRFVGAITDETILAILAIGASAQELEVAAPYLRGDGDKVDRAGHILSSKAAQIRNLLARDELYTDD